MWYGKYIILLDILIGGDILPEYTKGFVEVDMTGEQQDIYNYLVGILTTLMKKTLGCGETSMLGVIVKVGIFDNLDDDVDNFWKRAVYDPYNPDAYDTNLIPTSVNSSSGQNTRTFGTSRLRNTIYPVYIKII